MATINPQCPENDIVEVTTVFWETLTESDTAAEVKLPNKSDKTVTVTGTFGGATVVMQGSNDGTNWFTLKDAQGDNISFTAAGMALILENPLYIRPSASSGSSQDVDVIIIAKD